MNNLPDTSKPKIKHGFNIKLTRDQQKELEKIWNCHSEDGGMIILHPVLNWGPFHIEKARMNGAVINKAAAQEIMGTFSKAKQNS